MEPELLSRNRSASVAGFLFLGWILIGFYEMFFVSAQINMRDEISIVSRNILSHEFLFRTGIFSGLLASVLWVFLVFAFYQLFKSVNDRQARLLVALVIVQIPVSFITGAFKIATLKILKGDILKTFEQNESQDMAILFLKMNDYGVLTLELFWGLWLFPLAILVYQSRFLPRFIGVWLMINGIVYVMLSFASIVVPQYKDIVFKVGMPAMFGELVLMLWLLIKGAKNKL
jgi:hypothetical protein